MVDEHRTSSLSDFVRAYFWDYEEGRLDWDRHRFTIIGRLLEAGGLEAIRWLLDQSSDDELREFLIRRQGRGISPRRLRFWGLILDLPEEQVDAWVATARPQPWHRRTSKLNSRRGPEGGREPPHPHGEAAGDCEMEAKARTRSELHRLVDELPEAEAHAAKRYLEYLRDRGVPGLKALLEAPEEAEELTDEAKKRLNERLREADADETISHEDVRRELGF